jgi:hypothetical protein
VEGVFGAKAKDGGQGRRPVAGQAKGPWGLSGMEDVKEAVETVDQEGFRYKPRPSAAVRFMAQKGTKRSVRSRKLFDWKWFD